MTRLNQLDSRGHTCRNETANLMASPQSRNRGNEMQPKPQSRGRDTMKSTRLLLSMAALSAGLIISSGTRAEDWKPVGQFGVLGIGKVLELEKGHFYWVGEYGGTFFSDKEKGLFDHA